jgi:Xaa-Pro aminopeptidase
MTTEAHAHSTAGHATPLAARKPAVRLVSEERARSMLRAAGIDLVCAQSDEHLLYLSGHAPDSTLCHFYDDWACVLYPAPNDLPGALVIPEYDLAYQVTRPTWLPETRTYGSDWSSAATLLKSIDAGIGVETALRQPLRHAFAQTRKTFTASLTDAIKAYCAAHFGERELTIACDDLRFAKRLEAALPGRVKTVDARPVLRKIRAVKTEAEIDVLRVTARINDRALQAAAAAIAPGRAWKEMVLAYRNVLAAEGAKPLGERGMLFNSGPDGAFVLDHDFGESQTFHAGETVVLDAICEYRLYHGDMARTAVIGEPNPKQRRMYAAVTATLDEVEAHVAPGKHTASLSELASGVMQRHGFDPQMTTLLFHPIGLEIFDYAQPEHITQGWTLEDSSVVNFEVFYRDPAEGGMHLEDSIVVRRTGTERFSKFARDLIVVA